MALQLHNLKPNNDEKQRKKRVGRGDGSNKGTYSGRGLKGQRARSGGKSGLKLKGFRDVLFSLPKKRGFNSNKKKPVVVNVRDIDQAFSDGATVTPEALQAQGLVDDISAGVKILGDGSIGTNVKIEKCAVSKSAEAKINEAGGEVIR